MRAEDSLWAPSFDKITACPVRCPYAHVVGARDRTANLGQRRGGLCSADDTGGTQHPRGPRRFRCVRGLGILTGAGSTTGFGAQTEVGIQ